MDNKKLGEALPCMALRYLIFQHFRTKEIKWYFGKGQSDHSDLERDFQNEHTEAWRVSGGGFYVQRISEEKEDGASIYKLRLFGKSGSFGLSKEVLEEALPVLKASLPKYVRLEE